MHPSTSNLRGIALMVLATGVFVTNDTFMKLATEGLPPLQVLFLRGVSATIEQASREIAEARDTAVRRLATARTEGERTQIRREAAAQARAAIETATVEIRKSIALIRADEPQVARLQVEQGNAITAALEMVGSDLERVVGL